MDATPRPRGFRRTLRRGVQGASLALAWLWLSRCERQSIDLLPLSELGDASTAGSSATSSGGASSASGGSGGNWDPNDCEAGDCFGEFRCPPDVDRCEPCQDDRACPRELPHCSFRGYCVECFDGSDCRGPMPHCDPVGFRCVQPCNHDGDCRPDHPFCDPNRRTCVACQYPGHCFGTACILGECAECMNDSHCPGPTHCWNFRCRECRTNGDCPNGRRCDDRSGNCVGGP